MDNSADVDLEPRMVELAELLKNFHGYLKKSLVVLIPAISEEGFQSAPRKPLHDDFMEAFLDPESNFTAKIDD